MTVTASRAGIYTRTSRSSPGDGGSSARQEAECRTFATEVGVVVAEVYAEGDVSAFGRRPRPEFARLLADVASREIDLVIAWHPDRLYRRQRDLVPFIDTVQAAGASVATVVTGEVDLASPSGRMVARIVGALAEHESEHRAERLLLKHEELARDGRWPTSRCSYGYRYVGDGMLQIVPEEAAIIREAATRRIRGESLSAICLDFTTRDAPTPRDGRWSARTLRRILTRPSVYGYRAHHSTDPTRGVWEPILEGDTADRIRELMDRSSRPVSSSKVLRGLLQCARCGSPLRSAGRAGYRCTKPPHGRGCGFVSITASRADVAVLTEVLKRLDIERQGPSPRPNSSAPSPDKATLARQARLEAHATESTGADRQSPVVGSGDCDLSIDEQRSLIRSIVERVVVQPSTRRGGPFDQSRIVDGIVWRAPGQ